VRVRQQHNQVGLEQLRGGPTRAYSSLGVLARTYREAFSRLALPGKRQINNSGMALAK